MGSRGSVSLATENKTLAGCHFQTFHRREHSSLIPRYVCMWTSFGMHVQFPRLSDWLLKIQCMTSNSLLFPQVNWKLLWLGRSVQLTDTWTKSGERRYDVMSIFFFSNLFPSVPLRYSEYGHLFSLCAHVDKVLHFDDRQISIGRSGLGEPSSLPMV